MLELSGRKPQITCEAWRGKSHGLGMPYISKQLNIIFPMDCAIYQRVLAEHVRSSVKIKKAIAVCSEKPGKKPSTVLCACSFDLNMLQR